MRYLTSPEILLTEPLSITRQIGPLQRTHIWPQLPNRERTLTRVVALILHLLAQAHHCGRELGGGALACETLPNLHGGNAAVACPLDASGAGQDPAHGADRRPRREPCHHVWVGRELAGEGGAAGRARGGADEVVAGLAGDGSVGVHGFGLLGGVLAVAGVVGFASGVLEAVVFLVCGGAGVIVIFHLLPVSLLVVVGSVAGVVSLLLLVVLEVMVLLACGITSVAWMAFWLALKVRRLMVSITREVEDLTLLYMLVLLLAVSITGKVMPVLCLGVLGLLGFEYVADPAASWLRVLLLFIHRVRVAWATGRFCSITNVMAAGGWLHSSVRRCFELVLAIVAGLPVMMDWLGRRSLMSILITAGLTGHVVIRSLLVLIGVSRVLVLADIAGYPVMS